ncbi:unnamed protein product [Amaranthus hypochondriacus]
MEASGAPRRLKGHTDSATFCIASRQRPGVIFTAAEDGCVCLFDVRCKDVQLLMKLSNDAISSLCFKEGNENMIYLSSGVEVRCFDVQMATFEKPLESYKYNKDEINQISCNSKSTFLAAADDSGDVKIIDIQRKCPFKTLRSGHSTICSSAQFVPWKPWEVITGGLDSKMIMWDFSKGRPFLVVDFGNQEEISGNTGQFYNPAFIHAIAVPEMDMLDKLGKACAVARGDGIISLLNLEAELAAVKPKGTSKTQKSLGKTNSAASVPDVKGENQNEVQRLHLDHTLGGHSAAASCVTFSSFGEKGKFVISGGNDKSVKIWDWSRSRDETETSANNTAVSSINLPKKVNWLCTTPTDSENLVVCDTSKVVKVYTIA